MADLKNGCPPEHSDFKEAVCIDAGRVYDSCCEHHLTICILSQTGFAVIYVPKLVFSEYCVENKNH